MKKGTISASTSTSIGKSEMEKEKTKMRERQRRSITTKIFHGLRKHGHYNLPPRADINDVLRELAREAGWTVEPDGTTYRTPTTTTTLHNQQGTTTSLSASQLQPQHYYYPRQQQHFQNNCVTCITSSTGNKSSGTPTPTSSLGPLGCGGASRGGEGDCSTTTSPHQTHHHQILTSSYHDETHDQVPFSALYFSMPNYDSSTATAIGGTGSNNLSIMDGRGREPTNNKNMILINGGQSNTGAEEMSMLIQQNRVFFQQQQEEEKP